MAQAAYAQTVLDQERSMLQFHTEQLEWLAAALHSQQPASKIDSQACGCCIRLPKLSCRGVRTVDAAAVKWYLEGCEEEFAR